MGLFAEVALLETGWHRGVRIDLDAQGRIAAIEADTEPGPSDDVLAGRILLPAPANLHSHAFQRAASGLTERRGPGDDSFWTWRELMYRFLHRLTPDDIEAVAALVYVEMAEAGYAAVGEFHYVHHAAGGGRYDDMAETGGRIVAAAAAAGLGLTHLPVLYCFAGAGEKPLEPGQARFGNDVDGFLQLMESSAAHLTSGPADFRLGWAPHSLRATSGRVIEAVRAARPAGPIHMHIAEQQDEVRDIDAWLGARPVAWLLDNMEVTKDWCLIHATHLTGAEVRALAAGEATVGLCPITEADLGDGIFPASAYLVGGGLFGVGSDSNVRISLAEELRVLEFGQRLSLQRRNVLAAPGASTGRTLFEAINRGGARALGRTSGAIAAGNWADLLTLDADSVHLHAKWGDAWLDSWIFGADDRLVRDVWSAGRRIVTEGRHVRRTPVEQRYRETLSRLRADL